MRIVDVLDKGSGAVVVIDADMKDATSGELLARSQWVVFFVGAGNFGGPRSSKKVYLLAFKLLMQYEVQQTIFIHQHNSE